MHVGPLWDRESADGGPGGFGVVDGFLDDDKEFTVVWKRSMNKTNHVWGHVQVVGRAVSIHVGDVVTRGIVGRVEVEDNMGRINFYFQSCMVFVVIV